MVGTFKADIYLDKSKKPKLESDYRGSRVTKILLFIFLESYIAAVIGYLAILIFSDLADYAVIVYCIPYIFFILKLIFNLRKISKKIKQIQKNRIHGDMVITNVNGQCLAVFKSQYQELLSMNLDNVINTGHVDYKLKVGGIKSVSVHNHKAELLYLGNITQCAIDITTEDGGFIQLLELSDVM